VQDERGRAGPAAMTAKDAVVDLDHERLLLHRTGWLHRV
jgi:hypothetical protein